MAEIPYLVKDLALILMVAGIVTLIFKRLKQPLVLGYIVAGFLVSPHMPYTMSVMDETDIQTWADIGVIFTLFSLGLDFSFKKIVKMGASPIIACIVIVFSMMMLGISVGHSFGWGRMDCIFLGGMLAMSSTTIIYKAFDDMGLRQQKFASMVMSVLILEDILAIVMMVMLMFVMFVVMMVMLSAIAGGNNPDGEQMFASVLRIGFFLVLWFIVGIFAIPLFLRSVRKFINGETLLIVSLGLCCGMAVLSTKVGFSSAFGAFVMGSILAETIEAEKIIKLVEPVNSGRICRSYPRARSSHSDRTGNIGNRRIHAGRRIIEVGDALRILDGADWRVLLHYRLTGIVAGSYQQLPLSGSGGSFSHHHLPHPLYDPTGAAFLSADGEASA